MKLILHFVILLLLPELTFSQIIPSYVPSSGLVAWYPFSGNAIDSSGNGNNGTIYGCSLTTDRYGHANSAYFFDGTSNYISIPSSTSLDLISDLSVSAWVKSSNFNPPSGVSNIVWRGDAVSAHDPYSLYLFSNEAKFRRDVDAGTTINEVGFTTSIIDTAFFHLLVGTYDSHSGYLSIYFDGTLTSQDYLPTVVSYPTSSFWNIIGSVDIATSNFFNGTIDDIGIWNRSLSPCEVSKLYYSSTTLITRQPKNDTVHAGEDATFSINDTGGLATYQWQVNSGSGFVNLSNSIPYSGVNTRTLTVASVSSSIAANTYRCLRYGALCTDSSISGKIIFGTTETGAINNIISNINVYPNPNNGDFTISGSLSLLPTQSISFEVINMIGQVVYSDKIVLSNGTFKHNLSLNKPKGVYLLRIYSDRFNWTHRLIID